MAWHRYFGAAKQLPGVKELFEKEAPRQLRRTRHQMYALINADYYGFRDEEDGVLDQVEAEAERSVRQKVRPGRLLLCFWNSIYTEFHSFLYLYYLK